MQHVVVRPFIYTQRRKFSLLRVRRWNKIRNWNLIVLFRAWGDTIGPRPSEQYYSERDSLTDCNYCSLHTSFIPCL
ncbi:hypothetical protein TWF718_001504 [Orbilia javanica]|uniref:Uncharacterized protein n=1 Tax=Orbilia javanica TaxID=47235 RepID=A0AAN8RHC6_9PEZI